MRIYKNEGYLLFIVQMATRKLLKKIIKNGQAYDLPSSEDYVDKTSNQTVAWVKTFSSEPVIPSKTTDATNNGTKPATEAQVYSVAEDLSTLDGAVVKTSGNQNVGWVKTFTSEPVLPSKTTDATNDGTKPATEAQVYGVAQSIPSVIDDLSSTSTNSALSANQGRILKGYIDDLMAQGKFLSLWDCTTWLPISFPLETPYSYSTWDYFMVEVVSSATPPVNYRPNGSSYTGTASSTAETDEVEVWDYYVYDGSVWLLASNHWKTVSFGNIAGDALDNVNLAGYLNTKTFILSSTSDTTTAQAALDWYLAGKNPIIVYNNICYILYSKWSTQIVFRSTEIDTTNSVWDSNRTIWTLSFTLSSNIVTSITKSSVYLTWKYLRTDYDYSTPYTPQYDWSPATKKYVDDKKSTITVTLAAANWSSQSITVSATGVTASNTLIVSPDPSDFSDYTDAVIYCSAQGTNSLTFVCDTTPSNDIDVNVVILN